MCGQFLASTEHSLLYCDKIRHIWKGSQYWEVLSRGKGFTLLELASICVEEMTAIEYEVWVVMLWMVWRFICKCSHDRDCQEKALSIDDGQIYWKAFQDAKPSEADVECLGIQIGCKEWRRPNIGTLRVDVDALFDKENERFGVGVIVRDHWNKIRLARARQIYPSSSSVMAELKAIIHGVLFCLEYKTGPIEIYTDSIVAARLLANPEEYNKLLPDEVCDTINIARRGLLIDVFHAYRSAMRAAHALAQFSAETVSHVTWTCNFPTWLEKLLRVT